MKKLIVILGILLIGWVGQASAAETQVFSGNASNCEVLIPADWTIGEQRGQVTAFSVDSSTFVQLRREATEKKKNGAREKGYHFDGMTEEGRGAFLQGFKNGFNPALGLQAEFVKLKNDHFAIQIIAYSPIADKPAMVIYLLIKDGDMSSITLGGKTRADFDKSLRKREEILDTWKVN